MRKASANTRGRVGLGRVPRWPSSGDKGEGGLVRLESRPEEGYILVQEGTQVLSYELGGTKTLFQALEKTTEEKTAAMRVK